MRFALLGIDDRTRRIAGFLRNHADHQIVVAFPISKEDHELADVAPHALSDEPWESVLATAEVDAAILAHGHDQEQHDDRLRKLAQEGIPLLVSHPSCSAIVAFEIDMIRRDVGGVVVPLLAGRSHPAIPLLRQWIQNPQISPIGVVEKIELERVIEQATREVVRELLAQDAHLLGSLMKEITTVSAVGSGVEGRELDGLTVHLGNPEQIPTRWSAQPRGHHPRSLRLFGSDGAASLQMPSDPRDWKLAVEATEPFEKTYQDWNGEDAAVDDLRRALEGQPFGADWPAACRDLETAETAEVSLRRRRTIDVFSETPTEESSFKGFMAAGSCALLLMILMGFMLLAVIEGFRVPLVEADPTPAAERWPFWLRLWPVYPLLAFLGLQLLLLVARRSPSSRTS